MADEPIVEEPKKEEPGLPVNPIGEIKQPDKNASEEEWRAYFKQLDSKSDEILKILRGPKEEPLAPKKEKAKKSLLDEALEC